jgi:hypothetical protein
MSPREAPTRRRHAELARDGELETLLELSDGKDGDAEAYKWLSVAVDFGHAEAGDLIDELVEASSLRFDDDQFLSGGAHLELGVAYLLGEDGLPFDLAKGRAHLAEALNRHYPASVQGGDAMLAEARTRLTGDALSVFDSVYPPPPSASPAHSRPRSQLQTVPFADARRQLPKGARASLARLRMPERAVAQVCDGDWSCDGDLVIESNLFWIRGDLTVGNNLSVLDSCLLVVDGALRCNNALLFGCHARVGTATIARGVVAAGALATAELHATAVIHGAGVEWVHDLPDHDAPLLVVGKPNPDVTLSPEILDSRGTLDRSRLVHHVTGGGVVRVEPVVPEGHLTAQAADARIGRRCFVGQVRVVPVVSTPVAVKTFDADRLTGPGEAVLIAHDVTVSGRMPANASTIAIEGNLRVGSLELGDGVLVVNGTVTASLYVFAPDTLGTFAFAGKQLDTDGPSTLDVPIVVWFNREADTFEIWVRDGTALRRRPDLLKHSALTMKSTFSPTKALAALRANRFPT